MNDEEREGEKDGEDADEGYQEDQGWGMDKKECEMNYWGREGDYHAYKMSFIHNLTQIYIVVYHLSCCPT